MAENKIQTRISLKYDTYSQWQTKNPVLLKGELAIATLATDLAQEVNNTTKQPILFKVGDGTSKFNALPWASALAADVYAWAKKSEDEFKAWLPTLIPVEVIDNGTGKFVTDVTATTTNGKHVITITRADVAWGDVTGKPTNIVNTVKTNGGDGVVVLKPTTAVSGDVTIEGEHKKYSKAGSIAEADSTTNTAGTTATIKVPKITVDEYGHTTYDGTTTHTIKIPDEVAVGSGDLTTEGDSHITVTGSFNANQDTDSKITVTHNNSGVTAGQYGADGAVSVGEGETKTINVPSVTVDAKGHVTAAADKILSITIPKLPTNHVTTDTQQDITADKIFRGGARVTVSADNGVGGSLTTTIGADAISLGDGEGASLTINSQYISTNSGTLHFPGNYNTDPYDTTIATLDDVRKIAAGAVDYRGTVSSQSDLDYLTDYERSEIEIGYGDFVRVAAAFGSYHAGDLLIYENDGNWTVIHGEEGDITKVTAGSGLTGGGSVGEVTVSHGAKPTTGSKQAATAGSGRTYITQIDVDTFGHIAKVYTATESDQDLSGYKTKQDAVSDKITDAAHVLDSLTQNANGEISYTVKKLTPADIGAKAVQTAVSDPTANGKSLTFIDTISQNTQGVITATKKNVNLDAYALKTDIPSGTGTAGIANVANDIVTIKGNATLTGHTLANGNADDVTLAKVAKTGSIYDMAEGSNATSAGVKYLIFDCGSASDVI